MPEGIELKQMGGSAPTPPPQHPDSGKGGLGKAYRMAEEKAKAAVHLQEGGMDATSIWGCASAAWYAILAVPLLLFPRILLFFAQTPPTPFTTAAADIDHGRDHYDALTPLEGFLCLSISLGLFALAIINVLALVPTYAPPTTSPGRVPLLGVQVGLVSLMSVVAYNTRSIGALGVVVGGGNCIVAVWGWWVLIFGNVRLKTRDSRVPKRLKKL